MPLIAPFRGLRYSQAAGPPDAVISPAWDVVSPREQALYLALHPHNFIHLIAPCGEEEGGLETAASTFRQWQREGVLIRDPRPARLEEAMEKAPEYLRSAVEQVMRLLRACSEIS